MACHKVGIIAYEQILEGTVPLKLGMAKHPKFGAIQDNFSI